LTQGYFKRHFIVGLLPFFEFGIIRAKAKDNSKS